MNFTMTEQADLKLQAITSSSFIEVDSTMYSPTMAASTQENKPFRVLYDHGDVEWLTMIQANTAVRFHAQTRLF